MNKLLYILISILCLTACQSEEMVPKKAMGTLCLTLQRRAQPVATTRTVAEGLAVDILTPDKNITQHFDAGSVPTKIILDANVKYTVRAYTDNQNTWPAANEGKGEACYWGETTVTVGEDETVYCNYAVPMTNYAVTLTLPELFDELFKSYTFTLKSGTRSVNISEGEKAYFAVPDAFTYKLTATNNDDKTSSHSAIEYPDVEAGKLYNIKYVYGATVNTGGIDIDITDNTEHEDIDINI